LIHFYKRCTCKMCSFLELYVAVLLVCMSSVFCVSWETGADQMKCNEDPDCVNPKQDELAILVTGGLTTEESAEVLSTNGTWICDLPEMTESKVYHTQTGLTACGGGTIGSDTTNCIKFESGSWITLTDNLVYSRSSHSSWRTPSGDILLIGGLSSGDSGKTTEIVFQNGTSIRSFDLKSLTYEACSIELPEMFILTGGRWTMTKAGQYTASGWMEDLPELNEGRRQHGCGFYFNNDMEKVYLVAGGYDNHDYISTTETLVEGGQAWNFQQPLPTSRLQLRGISLPDTVIMTGGFDHTPDRLEDLLMFDPMTFDWKKIGAMKTRRYKHGASLVNIKDVLKYCET